MLYHINCETLAVEDFRKALANAISLALNKGIYDIGLAVNSADDLDGPVSNTLGENSVKILKRPGGTIISSSVRLHMLTQADDSTYNKAIVIAMGIPLPHVGNLTQDGKTVDLVYVPRAKQDLREYQKSYQSTEIQ